jgi:3-deoxy-manno-octulosonate cytidylyltransferase (CMP-KDO synthetase)
MPSTAIMIPARLGSSRFPNKPLALIAGKAMIIHVIDRCREANLDVPIYVVTDSKEILTIVEDYGETAVLTGAHFTGSDRLAEANDTLGFDFVINVQGDEPVFAPSDIRIMHEFIQNCGYQVATGYTEMKVEDSPMDSNTIKTVVGVNNNLVYVSRAKVPGHKGLQSAPLLRQVCIYGYQREFLALFGKLSRTPNEVTEDHELLRFMDHGYPIGCVKMSSESIPVDVLSDIELVENELQNRN